MNRDIDDALTVAAKRALEAEEEFIATPVESPEIVIEARIVEHRAEDIHVLAEDATKETEEPR